MSTSEFLFRNKILKYLHYAIFKALKKNKQFLHFGRCIRDFVSIF